MYNILFGVPFKKSAGGKYCSLMAFGVALSVMTSMTSSGAACGCFSKYAAATPATEGAAIDCIT